jgi:hypothetical protein
MDMACAGSKALTEQENGDGRCRDIGRAVRRTPSAPAAGPPGCVSAGICGVGRLNRMTRYAFRRPPRAVSGHMEPFDRDDFAPWLGACRSAMWCISGDMQQRHGAKEPGLRWAKSAPRRCCGARPMHHIARRAAPCRMNRFGSIKLIPYGRIMLSPRTDFAQTRPRKITVNRPYPCFSRSLARCPSAESTRLTSCC